MYLKDRFSTLTERYITELKSETTLIHIKINIKITGAIPTFFYSHSFDISLYIGSCVLVALEKIYHEHQLPGQTEKGKEIATHGASGGEISKAFRGD